MEQAKAQSYNQAMGIMVVFFFIWGGMDCMNDILLPFLKEAFELEGFVKPALVTFGFFFAYFVGSLLYFLLSLSSGDPILKIGYKNAIIIGLCVAGVGCLLFFPAAHYHTFGAFIGALFVLGLGMSILQIACNPYVAVLGSAETAAGRLNLAQGINSFAKTVVPLFGGFLLFEYFAVDSGGGPEAIKIPYLTLAGIFFALALGMRFIKLPRIASSEAIEKKAGALKPHLILGMVAVFVYVGSEVSIGSFFINYLKLDEVAALPEHVAKNFLAYYWGGAMIGRFLGAISLSSKPAAQKLLLMLVAALAAFFVIYVIAGIPLATVWPFLVLIGVNYGLFLLGRFIPQRTLAIFAATSVLLLLGALMSTGALAMWLLIGVGLFNSIMWSNIFTLAIDGLGKFTSQGSSLLIMMILGGAVFTLVQGFLAESFGLKQSFVLPLLGYLYLIFYGVVGHRVGRETPANS